MKFLESLEKSYIIADGAFGTYYNKKYRTEELPEKANIYHEDRVIEIHKAYIKAGASLIRTNSFASNTRNIGLTVEDVLDNVRKSVELAKEAIKQTEQEDGLKGDVYVAGDIGPIDSYDSAHEYELIAKTMCKAGVDALCFETQSDTIQLIDAIAKVKEEYDIPVIVQYALDQFGYSSTGFYAKNLLRKTAESGLVDVMGFNCGIGPGHMKSMLKECFNKNYRKADGSLIYFSALPNAGYPENISNRLVFASDTSTYFSDTAADYLSLGVRMIGGCCGTTPLHIEKLKAVIESLDIKPAKLAEPTEELDVEVRDNAFFAAKKKKLVAVELAPPFDCDDEKLMNAAHILAKNKVDVVTFPDSPSGRTRVDSVLMAAKVARENGLCVMPHICCRDKNTIAIRSQLMGAYVNGIDNFLVITGDPVPLSARNSIKSVYQFDSVGLMNLIDDINSDKLRESPLVYGGAINQNRRNLEHEIERVKKKMKAGARFFMSQPAFDDESVERLRRIKEETSCRMLCGIMPFVSYKNALFMKNEIAGILVPDEIIERYPKEASKEEGQAVGIELALEMIEKMNDFADGYYFSFPFNRVEMLEKILDAGLI